MASSSALQFGKQSSWFFNERNAKSVLHAMFKQQQWIPHPWLRYRGLSGTEVERFNQLYELIIREIRIIESHQPPQFSYGYGSLLRKHYLDDKSIEEIAGYKDVKTVYHYLKSARAFLARHLSEIEPPFWHNTPPIHQSSFALESVFEENLDWGVSHLTHSTRLAICGLPNYRRSAIAAALSRRIAEMHLADACLWVRANDPYYDYVAQVQNGLVDFARDAQSVAKNKPTVLSQIQNRSILLQPENFANLHVLVVFDDVPDSLFDDTGFPDYIVKLPDTWKCILVTHPWLSNLPVDRVIHLGPLSAERIERFVRLYGKEVGLQEDEVTETALFKIGELTYGVIGEIDTILERASRLTSNSRLETAIAESSTISPMRLKTFSSISQLPGSELLHVALLFPAAIPRTMFVETLHIDKYRLDEQLRYLCDFKVFKREGDRYSLRSTWRSELSSVAKAHPQSPTLAKSIADYLLGLPYSVIYEKYQLYEASRSFGEFIMLLMDIELKEDALDLALRHAEWLFDAMYEDDPTYMHYILDELYELAIRLDREITSLVLQSYKIHMILRGSRVSDVAVQHIEHVRARCQLLLDQIERSSYDAQLLIQAQLSAKRSWAYYLRNIGNLEDALVCYREVAAESQNSQDSYFNDILQGQVASTLMRTGHEADIESAINILNEQIEWARRLNLKRRASGSLGRLAEAYRILALLKPSLKLESYQRAIHALSQALELDRELGRGLFLGTNSISLARIYNDMANDMMMKVDDATRNEYRVIGRQLIEAALPYIQRANLTVPPDLTAT